MPPTGHSPYNPTRPYQNSDGKQDRLACMDLHWVFQVSELPFQGENGKKDLVLNPEGNLNKYRYY
ncbi:hypothetical protein P7K49_030242 [Saguinus oedipus]|uniref:Uncharacterized protein n=1 Tax=Saguinus oedipus TaxID=9490 RepID=A0ABQ9U1L9_SAGOE|nr:hypothetical protein P7K49_030242 [Saguinus oedipus]